MNCETEGAPVSYYWPPMQGRKDLRAILAHHEAGHLCVSLGFERGEGSDLVATLSESDPETGDCEGACRPMAGDGDIHHAGVNRDERRDQVTKIERGGGVEYRGHAMLRGCISAAGIASEALYLGVSERVRGLPARLSAHGDVDGMTLGAMAEWAYPDAGRNRFALAAYEAALELLREDWEWVQRVAREIELEGHCTGERARALR